MDVERRVPGRAPLHEEPGDLAVVLAGPHHRHVGDGPVGDPELGAVQHVAVALAHGPRLHGAGVRAVVGLGEAEAADGRAAGQRGQPAVLLGLRAIGVDGVHHQAALDRGRRAQPRVAALQLLHDEAVGHVVEPGAPVALEGGAEDAHLAELRDEADGKRPRPVVLGDDGEELGLHPVANGVAHHPLVLGQERLDAVVVDPVELLHRRLLRGGFAAPALTSAVG